MAYDKLVDLLDRNHAHYTVVPHKAAYTATETAERAQIPGREFAKTVVVKVDGRLAMAVLPATDNVNVGILRSSLGARDVSIAREYEFGDQFSECEMGAMPPFGHLFGMEVFVSPHLAADEQICFNAGSHHEMIRMPYREFEQLASAVPVEF